MVLTAFQQIILHWAFAWLLGRVALATFRRWDEIQSSEIEVSRGDNVILLAAILLWLVVISAFLSGVYIWFQASLGSY